jgi:hypothetical protein
MADLGKCFESGNSGTRVVKRQRVEGVHHADDARTWKEAVPYRPLKLHGKTDKRMEGRSRQRLKVCLRLGNRHYTDSMCHQRDPVIATRGIQYNTDMCVLRLERY